MSIRALTALLVGLALVACTSSTVGWEQHPRVRLGLAVTEATGEEWLDAFEMAAATGIDAVELSLFWDDPGALEWAEIANSFYRDRDLVVYLTLSVIDTTELRLPADLRSLALDDPMVIERFQAFLDAVSGALAEIPVGGVSIGNEVDVYLAATGRWAEFEDFLAASADHARALFPGVPVSTKVTAEGMVGAARTEVAAFSEVTDADFVTLYHLDSEFRVRPVETFSDEVERLLEAGSDRPLHLMEVGFPSSPALGSSEQLQATFVETVFATVARHADRIRFVGWVWLTDVSDEAADEMSVYYGVSDGRFSAFIGSLGLRRVDGSPKTGWAAFEEAARSVR